MNTSETTAVQPKDIWQILRDVAPIVASIAVPLAITWVGGEYNARIKETENQIRYVELAIAQLRSPRLQNQQHFVNGLWNCWTANHPSNYLRLPKRSSSQTLFPLSYPQRLQGQFLHQVQQQLV